MGGEERVERQHASGRLTVRERIERLFDDGHVPRDRRAGRPRDLRRRRRADRVPARQHDRRPGPHRRPPRGRAGRRLHRPRRRRRRRDLGEGRLRRAAGARPAPPARPARRRHGRRRQRQVARADGLLLRAAAAGLRPRREEPVDRAGGGRGARPGRGPRRRARGLLALLGDRAGTRRSCSWPARRSSRWPAWARRPTRRSSAARACRLARAPWTTSPPTRTTRSTQLKRFLSYLPENVWEAPPPLDPTDPRRPPRGGARLDRPARPAPALQDAPRARGGARPRLGLRAGRRVRASHDHLPRAPRRPARRRARLRPGALRRRRHGGRRREDRPLRGHVRPVPPAGRELRGRARAS